MKPSKLSLAEPRPGQEEMLFLRRWLAHPLKVGALLPSSPALAKLVARNVARRPDQAVVELGAGTGSVTKQLLKAGIPADRLFVVELDGDLARFLQRNHPQIKVIQGDAGRLSDLIPREWHGRIGTVISGIPMVTLPESLQQRIIDQAFAVMPPGGQLLQYTYSLVSPIPERRHGLKGHRCGIAVANIPPAWVWRYKQASAAAAAA